MSSADSTSDMRLIVGEQPDIPLTFGLATVPRPGRSRHNGIASVRRHGRRNVGLGQRKPARILEQFGQVNVEAAQVVPNGGLGDLGRQFFLQGQRLAVTGFRVLGLAAAEQGAAVHGLSLPGCSALDALFACGVDRAPRTC